MERKARKKCAENIMEIIPIIMQSLGASMRGRAEEALSVHQFNALRFLRMNDGASLSQVCEANGMTLPTASKMIEVLVARGLVSRVNDRDDRRRLSLSLTPTGKKLLVGIKSEATRRLARMLEPLGAGECAKISESMELLGPVIAQAAQKG